jgi:hypothetical protein
MADRYLKSYAATPPRHTSASSPARSDPDADAALSRTDSGVTHAWADRCTERRRPALLARLTRRTGRAASYVP